jgi:hypothetical protein
MGKCAVVGARSFRVWLARVEGSPLKPFALSARWHVSWANWRWPPRTSKAYAYTPLGSGKGNAADRRSAFVPKGLSLMASNPAHALDGGIPSRFYIGHRWPAASDVCCYGQPEF